MTLHCSLTKLPHAPFFCYFMFMIRSSSRVIFQKALIQRPLVPLVTFFSLKFYLILLELNLSRYHKDIHYINQEVINIKGLQKDKPNWLLVLEQVSWKRVIYIKCNECNVFMGISVGSWNMSFWSCREYFLVLLFLCMINSYLFSLSGSTFPINSSMIVMDWIVPATYQVKQAIVNAVWLPVHRFR